MVQIIFENNQSVTNDLPAGKGDMTRLSNFFKRMIIEED
jgi:hypothetical protein